VGLFSLTRRLFGLNSKLEVDCKFEILMMVMGTGLGKTKDLKWDLKVYKQPSFSDPRFKHRTYVGDLWLGEKCGVFSLRLMKTCWIPRVFTVTIRLARSVIRSIGLTVGFNENIR